MQHVTTASEHGCITYIIYAKSTCNNIQCSHSEAWEPGNEAKIVSLKPFPPLPLPPTHTGCVCTNGGCYNTAELLLPLVRRRNTCDCSVTIVTTSITVPVTLFPDNILLNLVRRRRVVYRKHHFTTFFPNRFCQNKQSFIIETRLELV